MKINSSLLAVIAVGTISGVAHADMSIISGDSVNVQVYGIADAAVGQVQNSLGVDPQFPASVNPVNAIKSSQPGIGSVSGLFNGGISPSRFGIKGDVDVGSGVKGFFVLESGINVTTGQLSNAGAALASNGGIATTAAANSSIDGQLFSRQANVGLSSADLGSLALGRNYAPIFDTTVAYDPVQASQLFSPLGFSGTLGGGGGLSEDTRVDNSLKYTKKFGEVNVSALYKFGTATQENGFGGTVGYDNGKLGLELSYEAFQNGIKGASGSVPNQVALTNANTSAIMFAGKYKITNDANLKAGYETFTLSNPTTNLPTTGAGVGYYNQIVQKLANFNGSNQTTNVYWFGGDYNVTPKLNLAVGYFDVNQQQSADLAQKNGDSTYLSLLVDYQFSKRLDTYAGFMAAQYSGDAFSSGYYSSNSIFAVGARLKF